MLHDPVTIAALCYGAVLLAGIVAGATGRITVFADLSDLLATFALIVVAGMVAGLVLSDERIDSHLATAVASCVGALAALIISWRTWRANRAVPATLLAVATKLPFALGVPLLVIELVAPNGDSARQRAGNRARALLLLTLVAPIMLLLVRDRGELQRYLRVD